MYYNGNNRYPINSFLNTVHKDIINNYTPNNQDDKIKATQLQNFFQNIKYAAQNYNSNPIEDETIRLIVDTIKNLGIKQNKTFNIERLFGERGGARFENELTRTIQAVYENLTDEDFIFNKKIVNIGSQRTSVNISDELLGSKQVQETLKNFGTKTQRVIKDDINKSHIKQYYLQDVDGKIDVQGYEINITGNPTPELLKIYDLLKDATFTAKNYDSIGGTWEQRLAGIGEDISYRPLSLGESNPFRAIYSVLTDLGYEHRTAISAAYHGYNKIKKDNDENVSTHLYHIRLAYELMGIGLLYQGKSYGIAKYLIYNDPSGNIYVRSTMDILSELLKENQIPGNPFGHITLARSRAKS